uniref:TIGR02679 domain-containing protein n=1 Tax=Metallibacterium scheffleri TaxID=993689 RepID=UPI0023F233E8
MSEDKRHGEAASAIDPVRLRATLGRAELARLVAALRRRLELGRPLTGTLSLSGVTAEERAAFDELLGRRITRGTTLLVNLDALTRLLADAAICPDLESAVQALAGPIVNRQAAAARDAAVWEGVWLHARELMRQPRLIEWLDELTRDGTVKRLCATPQSASILLAQL